MAKLLNEDLTGEIIGVYYDVYNGLSRTFPEFIYENAMMQELSQRRVACTRQEEYDIHYKDRLIGSQRLDIFVADEIVVEIKVKPKLTKLHQAQAISYLKTTNREVGLVCNFGGSEPEFKRVYFNRHIDTTAKTPSETKWPNLLYPELAYQVIGGLFEVHNALGPGFIHRLYANACYHEMKSRGLETLAQREMTVFFKDRSVGEVKLNHLLIEGCILLFPLAIQDTGQIAHENLHRWMAAQGIQLGIITNFHSQHLKPEFIINNSLTRP